MDDYHDLIGKDRYNISGDPYGLTEGPDDINDDLDKIIIDVATSPDPLCNLPALSASAYNEAVASVSSTMSSFANSVSPLSCGAALQGVTAAFAKIRESIYTVPTVATAIQDATASAISSAAKVMNTVALDSSAVAALNATLQPSLAETVKPVLSAYAVDNATAATQELIAVNNTMSTVSSAVKHFITFDASKVAEAISKAIDAMDVYVDLYDRLMDAMQGMTDIFDFVWESSCHGLRRFTSFFFHLFLSVWRWKRRHPQCLPKVILYLPAIQVNIGYFSPDQTLSFVARQRRSFLQKHQRISNDSDDDLSDSNTPILVAV